MSSIYDFASRLNASVRPSQFRVHINFPAELVGNGAAAKETATFLTHQATIPGYTTDDVQVYYRGRIVHEAGEKTYNNWTCTVYNSSDFTIRSALEQWVNAINDPEVVAGITQPSIYKADIMVEQLDRNDQTLRVYKLVGAFPTNTGEIDLSFDSTSEVEKFTVEFVYDYFLVGGADMLKTASS